MKFLAQLIQRGTAVGIADSPGKGGGLGLNGTFKSLALLLLSETLDKEKAAENNDGKKDNGQANPDADFGNYHGGDRGPQGESPHA
ncbi:MAG: hypothetical protein ACREE6_05475, partial [Limisphaerales bacterium]